MWQDILKTQESVTDTKVGIFKPRQGFELDTDNNEKCCEDARVKMIEAEKEWHLSFRYAIGEGPYREELLEMQPWNDLNKKDCEELYDYLIQEIETLYQSESYKQKRMLFSKIKKEWDECEGKI